MKFIKNIKLALLFGILICVSIIFVAVYPHNNLVYASTNDYSESEHTELDGSNNATPYLFTTLSISINGGNGKVWTTARNDFTLFPSQVNVIIQLYSSFTYCENYNEMKLEAMQSTLDLDMGKTISVEASTNGEQKYWLGRMRYKIDNGDWQEKIAGVGLFNANGDFLGLT